MQKILKKKFILPLALLAAVAVLVFGSRLMMNGDMGQILGVLPVVLLSVLSISLLEAMLILPHHLQHSLAHTRWRQRVDERFDRLREAVGRVADSAIEYRYLTVGLALVRLVTSIVFGMLTSTLLILLVLPASYSIMEDFGLTHRNPDPLPSGA